MKLAEILAKVEEALDKTDIDDKFIDTVVDLYEAIDAKYEESGIRDKVQEKAEQIFDAAVEKVKEAELDEKAKAKAIELKEKAAAKAAEIKAREK